MCFAESINKVWFNILGNDRVVLWNLSSRDDSDDSENYDGEHWEMYLEEREFQHATDHVVVCILMNSEEYCFLMLDYQLLLIL